MPDAEPFEHVLGAPLLGRAHAPWPEAGAAVGHILQQGQMRKQGVILKHIADFAALGRHKDIAGPIVQRAAAKKNMAGIRAHQPGKTLHGQAFARTGRPEEHHILVIPAYLIVHVQAERHCRVFEALVQTQGNHRRRLFSFNSNSAAMSSPTQARDVTTTSQVACASLPA